MLLTLLLLLIFRLSDPQLLRQGVWVDACLLVRKMGLVVVLTVCWKGDGIISLLGVVGVCIFVSLECSFVYWFLDGCLLGFCVCVCVCLFEGELYFVLSINWFRVVICYCALCLLRVVAVFANYTMVALNACLGLS